MSTATSIEWTDTTWNPVTGCTKVSAGCKNCYAEGVAKRFWQGRKFTDVRCHEDRLDEPLRWRKPRRVFVNSMSDLFHEDVPFAFIDRVFGVMSLVPHTFQILTKRPERMRRYMTQTVNGKADGFTWGDRINHVATNLIATMPGGPHIDRACAETLYARTPWPLPNVWLGVSVEDQAAADARIPQLLQTPAALRFLSCEPLLSDVDLSRIDDTGGRGTWDVLRRAPTNDGQRNVGTGIDWVIVGGESGPRARPCCVPWIRSIVDQCKAAGVPSFVKQMGSRAGWRTSAVEPHPGNWVGWKLDDRKGGNPDEWPDDLRVREFPAEATA